MILEKFILFGQVTMLNIFFIFRECWCPKGLFNLITLSNLVCLKLNIFAGERMKLVKDCMLLFHRQLITLENNV